eukprot:TRINITY_DN41250_c0_g1_i1.p1 TRINITY_DN41250_c0_g1~~TRINITY_DN41250_c0_g1_i1.p1  ORF type:complete len:575 (-),score=110.90 TRINITY_DN41250_c0_g1_i1:23-1747(-)
MVCVASMTVNCTRANAEALTIRQVFEQWDADGNGTIERDELAKVMFAVAPSMTMADIDKLLTSIDTDGNGTIDFEEFTEWLTDPSTPFTLSQDGWLEETANVEAILRPLFNVFDKNHDSMIQMSEFHECFAIISNSLKMYPGQELSQAPAPSEPCKKKQYGKVSRKSSKNKVSQSCGELSIVSEDGGQTAEETVMDQILTDFEQQHKSVGANAEVSFEEFKLWHIAIFRNSGIPNSQLQRLVGALTEHLGAIMDIDKKKSRGLLNTNDSYTALAAAVEKLADVSRRLYAAKKHLVTLAPIQEQEEAAPEEEPDSPRCFWQDPSARLVATLIRACARVQGISIPNSELDESKRQSGMRRTSSSKRTAIVSHEIPKSIGRLQLLFPQFSGEGQLIRWLAKVVRMDGASEQSFYYELFTHITAARRVDHKPVTGWNEMTDIVNFNQAWEALPQELRLYTLLKTTSLMERTLGNVLDWPCIQRTLEEAEEMGLLTKEAIHIFNTDMHKLVMDEMRKNDTHHDALETGQTVSQAADEQLEQLQLAPMDVLGTLADLNQIQVSDDVWANILDEKLAAIST